MSKGLESLKTIRHIHDMECGEDKSINKDFDIIEKELTLSQDLLGHVTDLYKKKELDYYADREPFYYDYYIVFDTIPLKVSEELYDKVREQLDLPNKCWER